MTGRLDNKVAIVTGGASGIGAAIVDLFLREGAKVAIGDLRGDEAKPGIRFLRTDVTQEGDIAALVAFAVEAFGGLDILVNNAGATGTMAPLSAMDADGWDAVMALMPRAAMLGIKHAAPHIATRGGGSIVNIASIAALRPGISSPAYSVAKAGVIQLGRMAAVEFAGQGIRVNNICPGIIPTPNVIDFFGASREKAAAMLPEVAGIFGSAQPIPRGGRPEDIAETALFLASDASSFTTGQEFIVDGGMMVMGPGSLEIGRADGVLARTLALAENYR